MLRDCSILTGCKGRYPHELPFFWWKCIQTASIGENFGVGPSIILPPLLSFALNLFSLGRSKRRLAFQDGNKRPTQKCGWGGWLRCLHHVPPDSGVVRKPRLTRPRWSESLPSAHCHFRFALQFKWPHSQMNVIVRKLLGFRTPRLTMMF